MQVLCGQCGKVSTVDDATSKAPVECPHCGRTIAVADAESQDSGKDNHESPAAKREGFAVTARHVVPRKISLTCGKCGKNFFVSARKAGHRDVCPACHTAVRIPYPDDDTTLKLPDGRPIGPKAAESETENEPAWTEQDDLAVTPAPRPASGKRARGVSKGATVRDTASAGAARARRRKVNLLLAVALGLALTVAAAAVRLIPLLFQPEPPASRGMSGPAETDRPPRQRPHLPARASIPERSPRPESKAERPEPRKPAAPRKKVDGGPAPGLRVLGVETDVFAPGGRIPAAAGSWYVAVRMEVRAGGEPLELDTLFGQSVVLATSSGRHFAQGPAGIGDPLSGRAAESPETLPPGKAKMLMFVFEVPGRVKGGELTIRDVGRVSLPPVKPAPTPAPEAILGTFTEVPPRNLKPLLRDPVMAAIQGSPGQQILVRPGPNFFHVTIEPCGADGTARSIGNGLYEASLKHDDQALQCTIRLARAGRTLILYLADKPFHQIVFQRNEK